MTTVTTLSRSERAALASSLRLACMRISRRIRFESPAPVAPHQFSVMARLLERPHTARELADIEKVSAPSMSRTVAGLVDRDWVKRTDDPSDGRVVILTLTSEGVRVVKEAKRARQNWMALRIAHLDDEELAVLARASGILERIANE